MQFIIQVNVIYVQNGIKDAAVNGNALLQNSYIVHETTHYQLQKIYDKSKRNTVISKAGNRNNVDNKGNHKQKTTYERGENVCK